MQNDNSKSEVERSSSEFKQFFQTEHLHDKSKDEN